MLKVKQLCRIFIISPKGDEKWPCFWKFRWHRYYLFIVTLVGAVFSLLQVQKSATKEMRR